MSKLALTNFRELERILNKLKFSRSRQKGSHVVFHHSDGRTVSVPYHGSKDISRQLLRSILNTIDVTIDDYNNLR